MCHPASVSKWILGLKGGDELAAQQLWDRFSARLTEHARRKLDAVPKGIVDEHDIAQSVFACIWRGATAGRFSNVRTRDELWWLLLTVTKHKVISHIRRQCRVKRGGAKSPRTSPQASPSDRYLTLDQIVDESPSPEFFVVLEDEYQRLLALLGSNELREIAISRLQGFTVPEIATDLEISQRTVERKLQLIRKAWAKDFSVVN